jgi:hypothetical protein
LFCRQSSGRSLCTFSRSHRKISQLYAELTVWPVRVNYLWTITPMSKKNYEHALDSVVHLFRLSRSRWVCTLRVRLMFSSPNACLTTARVSVSLFRRFSQNPMHTVVSVVKSHQAWYTTPNKRT